MKKLAVPVVLILLGVVTLLALAISAGGIPEIQAAELGSGAFDGVSGMIAPDWDAA